MTNILITALVAGVGAFVAGFLLQPFLEQKKTIQLKQEIAKEIADAKAKAKDIALEGKAEALRAKQQSEREIDNQRKQLSSEQSRLAQKENALEKRYEAIEEKLSQIEKKGQQLLDARKALDERQSEILAKLEEVAQMTKDQAKDELLARVEDDIKEDALRLIKEVEEATEEEADRKARHILVTAMQRCATDVVAEMTVTTVKIPSDEMKGRIIGKEGRNIRSLEKETGVDIIVDDTPETVVLSSFDPIRRVVARIALEKLISDGRIHPARIEEQVEKARNEVEKEILQAGRQAAQDAKVRGLPQEVIRLMGSLKFRYSYGQNVLQHSVEASILASMLAAELGADVTIARKAAFLHDIGKAIDHKYEGTHTQLGADVLQKLKLPPEIVHPVRAHHEDIPLVTVEDYVVLIADAISGARPGARYDTMENYIERLTRLEEIGNAVDGVDKCFAIQAGREVRLMVNPQKIDDLGAKMIAKNIAKQIQESVEYPGQVKVHVIREVREVAYAK